MADRKWTRSEIENLFQTNDEFAKRCILKLFDRQTMDEQRSETTKYNNRIGVRPNDAYALSELAVFVKNRGYLTAKQLMWVRRKFAKYVGQLTDIANGKR